MSRGNFICYSYLGNWRQHLLIASTDEAGAVQGGMKVCLHAGTFAFHYKGSTVGEVMGADREQFRAPGRR